MTTKRRGLRAAPFPFRMLPPTPPDLCKNEPFRPPAKSKHSSEFASVTKTQAGSDEAAATHCSTRCVGAHAPTPRLAGAGLPVDGGQSRIWSSAALLH